MTAAPLVDTARTPLPPRAGSPRHRAGVIPHRAGAFPHRARALPAAQPPGEAGLRTAGSRRRAVRAEQGSITLLILGFALVLVLAIVGISAVSEVYLTRRSLAALSDDAALAGAQSIDEDSVVVGEPGSRRRLDAGTVQAAVAANLQQAGAGRLDGFDWSASTTNGDTVVVVRVRARSRIGIASALFGDATVAITERATAIAADNG